MHLYHQGEVKHSDRATWVEKIKAEDSYFYLQKCHILKPERDELKNKDHGLVLNEDLILCVICF